jgi:hypothetical protein
MKIKKTAAMQIVFFMFYRKEQRSGQSADQACWHPE